MPWFRTDDKFHDHRKTRRAVRSAKPKKRDAAAIGLWTLAGTWSSDHLRDGFVPADELDRWDDDGEALAERLVEAGFWQHATDEDGEPGYQFVNWSEHQPTKADVEAKRAEARDRMARHRQRQRTSPERESDVRANTERTSRGVREPRPEPGPTRPSAAAAADRERSGGGDAPRPLPGDVDILRSKMAAHVALAGLRWDIDDDRLKAISALIARHGDDRLVEWALRTCQNPPPRFASAFIGTWEAIGAPRAVEATRPAVTCDVCGQSKRSCELAASTQPKNDRHVFQPRSA
ncbi:MULTISPECIES: hypothetical protein [unclassified Aeromicrobium]|uniref:hypothetical protein n=1 Tax=unclassified Aeromicrobium TaxID=2633570 RepID=UPI00288A5219|nr:MULTISPECIES: hypothetical protein [unclassified Aeromicrobium]